MLFRSHWWFVGRRKIIESFIERVCLALKSKVPVREAPHILDVGCGTGANLEMLAQFGNAEGVDVSAEALEFCRARGLRQVKQGAAEALPYGDHSFDLVTGLDVVEHLDDDVAGLKEMRRVLRDGGRAVLFVPAFMFLWGVQDDISHHRRRYTVKKVRTPNGEGVRTDHELPCGSDGQLSATCRDFLRSVTRQSTNPDRIADGLRSK